MPHVKFSKDGRWADQTGSPGHPAREPFQVESGQVHHLSKSCASSVVEAGHGEIVQDPDAPKPKETKSKASRSKKSEEKTEDVLGE